MMGKTKLKKIKMGNITLTIDPSLTGKFDNDPFFVRKHEEAKKHIEKYGFKGLPQHIIDRIYNGG